MYYIHLTSGPGTLIGACKPRRKIKGVSDANTLHSKMDSNVCEQLSLPLTGIIAMTQDDPSLLNL